MAEDKYWVWFQTMFGFGTSRSHALLESWSCPRKLYEHLTAGELEELTQSEKKALPKAMECSERIIEQTHKKRCHIVTPDSDKYPPMLQHIYGKPSALYVIGDLGMEKDNLVLTVVGARRNSEYGKIAAEFFCEGLAYAGVTVVSGLANGIDSISLEAALENGGKTVGVLACGLDYDYPKESSALKRKILENGAVISEYPMGTKPTPLMFPPRNRIMAGMSHGVIVIEAGDQSGALVTAKLGFDSNREVFAVPNDIFSGSFAGSHRLIREGTAKLVTSPSEVLGEFAGYIDKTLHDKVLEYKGRPIPKAKKKSKVTLPTGMDEIVYKIYNVMDEDPRTAGDVAEMLNEAIEEVLGAVTTLEILGLITAKPGGYFVLS